MRWCNILALPRAVHRLSRHQLALIERSIAQALTRRRLDDRPVTQQLRGFANAYQHAKARLVDVAAVERRNGKRAVRPDVEAYLSSAVH